MEESTCHEMVIDLLKRFICMNCLFFAVYISFKYDFHVYAERIPRNVKKYLRRFFKTYLMVRMIFRMDIYRYSISLLR